MLPEGKRGSAVLVITAGRSESVDSAEEEAKEKARTSGVEWDAVEGWRDRQAGRHARGVACAWSHGRRPLALKRE